MTPNKQVSPAIRISQGERDASARATHLEAATRKFLVTTNERKYMSTKTNIKRVALVAIAALGLGVLSSVPSQAVISGVTVTTVNGTAFTGGNYDSSTAATITVSALLDNAATDSITVTYFAKSVPTGATANVGHLRYIDSTTGITANSTKVDTSAATTAAVVNYRIASGTAANSLAIKLDSVTAGNTDANTWRLSAGSNGFVGATFRMELDSATLTVGTYTYTAVVKTFTAGASSAAATAPATTTSYDLSIVVSASTAESTVASPVTSFVDLRSSAQSNTASDSADDVISAVSTVSSTNAGFIYVGNRNASGTKTTAVDSLTATVTGAGVVCATSDATPSASPTVTTCGKQLLNLAITGDYQLALRGDGTSGTSSINVTTKVSGINTTKSLSYYAATPASLTASVGHPILKIGTNDGAVRVTGLDSSGTAFTGSVWIYASSAADALIAGSTTPVSCGTYSTTDSRFNCPLAAIATGTAKFKVINASTVAAATVTSNEVTVTVANTAPATVRLSFDKASYAPNERARIYVTPLDATGKEIQSITGELLASGGISVNGAISYAGTTTTADSLTVTNLTTSASTSAVTGARAGSVMYTVYMPASGGTVTLSATGGSALPIAGRVALTATATVTDSGAAALAAVNALATTVASLRTLITTLTNLVLKIQKKVKA